MNRRGGAAHAVSRPDLGLSAQHRLPPHSHVMAVPRLRRQEQQQQQRRRWRKRDGESRHLHSTSVVLRLLFLRMRGAGGVCVLGGSGILRSPPLHWRRRDEHSCQVSMGVTPARQVGCHARAQLRETREMFMFVVDQAERANCGHWLGGPPPSPSCPSPAARAPDNGRPKPQHRRVTAQGQLYLPRET